MANRIPRVTVLLTLLFAVPGAYADESDAAGLYAQYCSVCHGDRGDSRSRARGSMIPPPRDFTSPQSAIELSRDRMIHSVTEGRPGTAMAPWKNQLGDAQIAAVVDYIRNTMMRPAVTDDSESGRRLYAENCSVCHGDDGRGARWTLTNLKPPPRNFTLPGTAEQLSRRYMFEVVRYGKADTAMPGFASQLDDDAIADVIDFVRTAFMHESMGAKSQDAGSDRIGLDMEAPMPQGLAGNASRGRAYYLNNCVPCHGIEGDGKGPRAYFILPKPRNFHHASAQHTLNRPNLFSAIANGSRGTDMPAWSKVLSGQEIADLAEYLFQTFIRPPQTQSQSEVPDKG